MRKTILLVMLAAFTFGCGYKTVTMYQMIEGKPEPVAELKTRFAGKGCAAAKMDKDGGIRVIIKQWATSDWSVARMFSWIADVASSLPIIGGGGNTNTGGMQAPTADIYDMDCSFDNDTELDVDEVPGLDPDTEEVPTYIIVPEGTDPGRVADAVRLLGVE